MFLQSVFFLCLLCLCTADYNNTSSNATANRYSYPNFYQPQPPICQLARGGRGVCVPLNNCPALREHSRFKDPRNLFDNSNNDYSCNSGPPFVCCPTNQQLTQESFTRPPQPTWNRPTAPSWERPTERPIDQTWNRPPDTSSWGNPNSRPTTFRPSEQPSWNRPTAPSWERPTERPIDQTWNRPPDTSSWGNPNSGPTTFRPSEQSTNRPWNRPSVRPTTATPDSAPSEPWIRKTTPRSTRTRPTQATTILEPTTTASVGTSGARNNHKNRRLLSEDTCGLDIAQKILGGEETSLEELPWMALLRLKMASGRTVYMCGGSLINSRYVLTAAHCLKGGEIPSSAFIDQVRLGEHDIDSPLDCVQAGGLCSPTPDDVDVEERLPHPQYSPRDPASINDIALLRLARAAKLSPPRSNSPVKLKVEIPVVPFATCAPTYRSQRVNIQEQSQLCAGGEPGKDSCQGDSGGPLMSLDLSGSEVRWHVTGIVSFGPQNCGEQNKPAIYTRVAQYTNWILDNIRE